VDSLTQIVLGAAVAEAVAGKEMGNKAAFCGAIAGTIPDLDVFLTRLYHPVDAALVHRGFSHSILFAVLMGPLLGYIVFRLYKRRYELNLWIKLFFLGIITHPMLDMFTNYGTEFLWPINWRITFNSVFVIDPLYTVPFMILLIIALFMKRDNPKRYRINMAGIYYSTGYLLYGVVVKLFILGNATNYFAENDLQTRNAMVTPMPLTSFYWMMLAEDDTNYYVGYKSLFYEFEPGDIDTVPKRKKALMDLKWSGKDYSNKLAFISNGYYTTEQRGDTLNFYDLRFGVVSKMTDGKIKTPLMGYGMVIDNGTVQKTIRSNRSDLMKHLNFGAYLTKIFKHE
jgi:inner membrane protein